ncbi:hypothetical protein PF010_g17087 [Phytophthora fragariae]|uniref:Uncharacterized protein n=2 Tax=Phytophthora TaxID=4783 RepID=A0A6G0KQ18_9STRA|nr:hypothetical protein PR002_g15902 [Phytophthora rubi]KAE9094470.1 hypothetical protein PF010_g17087 [Phytophthora fragariae]KAE9209396.1 hypothetical protein PF004_g16475 [Phytophthora fragariae]KAE9318010.1 hypothetical protein PF008_g18602 [Phytophthora fragariae]
MRLMTLRLAVIWVGRRRTLLWSATSGGPICTNGYVSTYRHVRRVSVSSLCPRRPLR